MYIGCAQKNSVAPPITLNFLLGQKQFLASYSSLKPPVGVASYYAIIFLDIDLTHFVQVSLKLRLQAFWWNFENCQIQKKNFKFSQILNEFI